jgi:F0F1-type ATP synthase epsilon subunit
MVMRQDASTGELVNDGKIEAPKLSDDTMHCKVYSPFKVYFEGDANSISAESATGPFDILPRHHNFITLLSPCDLVIRTGKDQAETFQISGGIMHVKANDVIVFLDV